MTDSPTQPPTASGLLADPVVMQALDEAWAESQAHDPENRHEEGGWIYMNLTTGEVTTRRATRG